jgi:hypothetical protein
VVMARRPVATSAAPTSAKEAAVSSIYCGKIIGKTATGETYLSALKRSSKLSQ